MLREQIPGPGQCMRSRLVASAQKRHDLIAELSVAHAFSGLFVSGREQQVKQIGAMSTTSPTSSNEIVDHTLQATKSLFDLAMPRGRDTQRREGHPKVHTKEFQNMFKFRADRLHRRTPI